MSAPPPVARLRRIAAAAPAALGEDDGRWLADQLNAWLAAGDGVTLDDILGLTPPPGREGWRTAARRAERDALIRDLARHFPGPSRRATAHAVTLELRRYEATAWPRDRRAAAMPDGYAGTAREVMLDLFSLGERVPAGWRQIARILDGDDAGVCHDLRDFMTHDAG